MHAATAIANDLIALSVRKEVPVLSLVGDDPTRAFVFWRIANDHSVAATGDLHFAVWSLLVDAVDDDPTFIA